MKIKLKFGLLLLLLKKFIAKKKYTGDLKIIKKS